MRKIMIFQHVGHEPLGTLNPMLKDAGFRIRYINFGRHPDIVPSLEGYNGLIILGGPMGVYEADKIPHLKTELKLIDEALKKNIPILGICLGSQLLASALGAEVKKAKQMELGWYDLHLTDHGRTSPLFSTYQKSEKVFQLHQDTFDLPKSAKHLAYSDLFEGQAFQYGEKVYGFQFHLEVDLAMIARWLQRPENRKMIIDSNGTISGITVIEETEKFIQRSLELSLHSFQKFIDVFQLPERPLILGSDHAKPIKPEKLMKKLAR